MAGKLLFDTLSYAKILKRADVENAEAHAFALSFALAHNIYSKTEIDIMVEEVIQRFEKQMRDFRLEVKNDIHDLRTEVKSDIHDLRTEVKSDIHDLRVEMKEGMHSMEARLEKSLDSKLTVKLSLMTGFLSLLIALSHFLH